MQERWTIPTANMTYIRLENYTNMVVGEHMEYKTFEVVVVVLLFVMLWFDVFVHVGAHPLLFLDKWYVWIYLNVNLAIIHKSHWRLFHPLDVTHKHLSV